MSSAAITDALCFTHGGNLRELEHILATGKLSSTAAVQARGDAFLKGPDTSDVHVSRDKHIFFNGPHNLEQPFGRVKHAADRSPGPGFSFVLVANAQSLVEQVDQFGVDDRIAMARRDDMPLEIDVRKLDCKIVVPDCYKGHVDRFVDLCKLSGKTIDTSLIVFEPFDDVRQMLRIDANASDRRSAQQELCRQLRISDTPTERLVDDSNVPVQVDGERMAGVRRREALPYSMVSDQRVDANGGAGIVAHMQERPTFLNIKEDLVSLFSPAASQARYPMVLDLVDRPQDMAHAVNMLVRMSPLSTYYKAFHNGSSTPPNTPFLDQGELTRVKSRLDRYGADGERICKLIDKANDGVLLDAGLCQQVLSEPVRPASQPVAAPAVPITSTAAATAVVRGLIQAQQQSHQEQPLNGIGLSPLAARPVNPGPANAGQLAAQLQEAPGSGLFHIAAPDKSSRREVTADQLAHMLASGAVGSNHLVWRGGMVDQWTRMGESPLGKLVANAAPPADLAHPSAAAAGTTPSMPAGAAERQQLAARLLEAPGNGLFHVASPDKSSQQAVTADQLAHMLASGAVGNDHLVWRGGMVDRWTRMGESPLAQLTATDARPVNHVHPSAPTGGVTPSTPAVADEQQQLAARLQRLQQLPGSGDFYVAAPDKSGQRQVPAEDFARMVARGEIGGDHFVWRRGMNESWARVGDAVLTRFEAAPVTARVPDPESSPLKAPLEPPVAGARLESLGLLMQQLKMTPGEAQQPHPGPRPGPR